MDCRKKKSGEPSKAEIMDTVKQIKEKKGSVNHVNANGWLAGESLSGDTFRISQANPLVAVASPGTVEFLIDSGATHHLVNDRQLLLSIESVPKITFGLAGSGSLESTHKGRLDINLKDSSLKVADVYYVPGVRLNILSVMKLRHNGWKIDFNSHALTHGSTAFRMTSSGLPKVTCFGVPRRPTADSISPLGNTFAVPQIDSALYSEHVRLGHIGRMILIDLAKGGNLRYPLEDLKNDFKLFDCQLCLAAMLCKQPKTGE